MPYNDLKETQISRLKVGWIAPCVGIGGADAYMMGLIKHTPHLLHTGIAIADMTSVEQVEWVQSYLHSSVPMYQTMYEGIQFPGWHYYSDFGGAIYNATKDCDIIVTWGCPGHRKHFATIKKPVVGLSQNEDEFCASICKDNEAYYDFRVACSEAATKAFGSKGADRVIYNAVDPIRVCPRYGREFSRHVWGLENRKVILFLGRMVDEKNPGLLIASLKHLPKEWCIFFVGRGYRREDLIKECQRHVGANRVYFANPQYQVGDILAASDVFCLPSDFEGLPLALLEAWLAGVPTVCTDFTAIRELHDKFKKKLSIVVPRKCAPEILAKAILEANDKKSAEIKEMCSMAHAITWNNFNIVSAGAQWEETLYDFYHMWFTKRSRMQTFEVGPDQPLTTAKAHVRVVDTSQESIAKWDKI